MEEGGNMLMLLRHRSQPSQPSRQPVFLRTVWRHLAMLNYEIDPALLKPHLPAGTLLDTYDGKHYISVVGLMFLNTRLYGVPVPFHRDFEELNLRFYVRREAAGEVRRGVVFIKEVVPRSAIAMVARAVYNENYVAMPMRHTVTRSREALSVAYHWRQREAAGSLVVRAQGRPALIQDDTEEEFIAEHYWGYVVQRDGGTLEYAVEHPRWRVWLIEEAGLDCDVERLYGSEFAAHIKSRPASALLAEGSPVVVRKGARI